MNNCCIPTHYQNNILATSMTSHLPWIQIPQTGGKTKQRDTHDWLNWHSAIHVHPRPPFRLNEFFQLPD